MKFPENVKDAMDQLDLHVIENLMPPPHYKYRLNALMAQKLKEWDVGKTGKLPVLELSFTADSVKPSVNPNRKVAILKRTGLAIQYDEPTFNKFIGISNERD